MMPALGAPTKRGEGQRPLVATGAPPFCAGFPRRCFRVAVFGSSYDSLEVGVDHWQIVRAAVGPKLPTPATATSSG
jgi:hypothetical protein